MSSKINEDGRALRPLGDWLLAGADELARQPIPPAQEAATLAAMRRALRGDAKPESWLARWWPRLSLARPLAWSGAACCAFLLLGAGLLLSLEPPAPQDAVERRSASGFLPLVSGERWASYLQEAEGQGAQVGTAWVVATELPRERLALLGLPYDPAQAGERVPAELLMHASGDVLAVRLLR
ncbi:hypothetical protein [Roseateles violae]|uniref:Anti-sigma-K factor RskA n=1 Tax=Roseateles violae TaxID=3058042 RepID=A0ABT8DKU5_9BURK|nr:hypothetical protein [Pelomonas sp. PFR6]MDN3919032.1 hypothetical protein [Pelomonas sp. PFR6]